MQLAFAVGAVTSAFSPIDAAAQLSCPITGSVSVSILTSNTVVCNINAPGVLTIALPSGQLNNGGTLNNNSGATLNNYNGLFSSGSLSNAGTLNNKSGTLYNAGGSLTNLATGTINNTSGVGPPGAALANGGSFSNLGTLNNSGSLFNRDGLYGPATLSNGATGKLYNNSGGYLWNYATLSNTGTLKNNSGAKLFDFGSLSNAGTGTLSNAGALMIIGALSNYNTLNNTGRLYTGALFDTYGNIASAGSLSNKANGVLNNNSGGNLVNYFTLSNAGTLNNNSGATLTNETLIGRGTLSNTGTLNNNSGATLNNNATLKNYNTLSNAGTLTNDSILRNYSNGTLSNSGTLNSISSFINGGTLSNSGTLNQNYSALINTNNVSNSGALNIGYYATLNNRLGATLSNSGTLRLYSGSNSGSMLLNSGTLTNLGTLHLYSYSYTGTVAGLSNSGTLTNYGSIINDGAIANIGAFTIKPTGAVTGSGSFAQTTGSTTANGAITQGTFDCEGGTVNGTNLISATNLVLGAGCITMPGNSPGTLTLDGGAAGVMFGGELDIEVASASLYDILSVVGAIHFLPGSELKFIFEGYTPLVGDSFLFLDSDVIDGFSNLSFLFEGLPPGFDFQLSDAGNGNLVFVTLETPADGGTAPEPGTALLVALGLVGIAGLRLRQRPAAGCRMSMQ